MNKRKLDGEIEIYENVEKKIKIKEDEIKSNKIEILKLQKFLIHQAERIKKSKWENTHPLIDIISSFLLVDIVVDNILPYLRGSWCLEHEQMFLGTKCLLCLPNSYDDYDDEKTSSWELNDACLLHKVKTTIDDDGRKHHHLCIISSNDEDKLLFKEWMKIQKRKKESCEVKNWFFKHNCDEHFDALQIIVDKFYDEEPLEVGTFLIAQRQYIDTEPEEMYSPTYDSESSDNDEDEDGSKKWSWNFIIGY